MITNMVVLLTKPNNVPSESLMRERPLSSVRLIDISCSKLFGGTFRQTLAVALFIVRNLARCP